MIIALNQYWYLDLELDLPSTDIDLPSTAYDSYECCMMDDPLKFKARAKMFQNIGVQGFDACIYACVQLLITAKVF